MLLVISEELVEYPPHMRDNFSLVLDIIHWFPNLKNSVLFFTRIPNPNIRITVNTNKKEMVSYTVTQLSKFPPNHKIVYV